MYFSHKLPIPVGIICVRLYFHLSVEIETKKYYADLYLYLQQVAARNVLF